MPEESKSIEEEIAEIVQKVISSELSKLNIPSEMTVELKNPPEKAVFDTKNLEQALQDGFKALLNKKEREIPKTDFSKLEQLLGDVAERVSGISIPNNEDILQSILDSLKQEKPESVNLEPVIERLEKLHDTLSKKSFSGGISSKRITLDKNGRAINPATEDKQPFLTRFKESLTAFRTSQFNFKPTWGVSTLRYTTTNTGTGATAGETSGEFRLQSGTANNGESKVETNQRGQYRPGSMGQAGIGVRVPTAPTSTAYCEWGYTDFTNGFYFGVDATGNYVAYVSGGSVTKIYQTDWNLDKLDGNGASKLTLDLSEGVISQIDFTWYGYGDIEWSFLLKDPKTNINEKIPIHRVRLEGSVSVVDPNQPLSFRSGNGASGTTNTSLYIGGHQFSVVDGNSFPPKREFSELVTSYTTATNTNWQPLVAFRKKATFNGRTNSVLVRLKQFEVAADADMEVRVTIAGTTSNLSWGAPTGVTATETAVETKVTGGTALTTSADGQPRDYAFVNAGGVGTNRGDTSSTDTEFALGAGQEVILWVRRQSATGAMIVKHAHVTWEEEW